MYTDAWRFGDDPENIDECPRCGYDCAPGRALCQVCFDAEHGPDNDKHLDPERTGGYTFDVAALFEIRKGI